MRVLLLAATTGYQTRSFGEAAERLGVDLVYATDRCNVLEDPWQDGALPVRFYDEIDSTDAIVRYSAANRIDGIVAVGDRPTPIAARVARALGLKWHSHAGAVAARHKLLTRERLRDGGLMVPWFRAASIDDDPRGVLATVRFPAVVKAAGLSASRGVIRANDAEEFTAAWARLRTLVQAPDIRAERSDIHNTVVIEGFVEGREFALEGVMTDGSLRTLAIFDKPDPLDGPFFEETIYLTPSREAEATLQAMHDAVAQASAAIGLHHGPVHAECRVNARGVFVLEVAARPIGGLCARALRFVRNGDGNGDGDHFSSDSKNDPRPHFSLEELLLRHAIAEPIDAWQREPDASGVMMIPIPRRGVLRGVSGLDAARAVEAVEDVRITAKPDQLLVPLPEGASYLGFIFARAATPTVVERALRRAHARLDFAIDPELRVVQSVHG